MLFKHRRCNSGFPGRPLSLALGSAENTPRAATLSLRRGCAASRHPRRLLLPRWLPPSSPQPPGDSATIPGGCPLPAGRLPCGQPSGACRTAWPLLRAPPMPRLGPRPGSSAMAPGSDPAPGLARPLAVPRRSRAGAWPTLGGSCRCLRSVSVKIHAPNWKRSTECDGAERPAPLGDPGGPCLNELLMAPLVALPQHQGRSRAAEEIPGLNRGDKKGGMSSSTTARCWYPQLPFELSSPFLVTPNVAIYPICVVSYRKR